MNDSHDSNEKRMIDWRDLGTFFITVGLHIEKETGINLMNLILIIWITILSTNYKLYEP